MVEIERRTAVDLFGSAVLTVLLFQIDLMYAVFTVPLHVIALKRRDHVALYAAGLAAAAIGIQELIRFSGIGVSSQHALLVAVAVYAPAVVLAATILFHLLAISGMRRLYRFLMSLVPAAVYGFIVVMLFERESPSGQQARELMLEQFMLIMQIGQQTGMEAVFPASGAQQLYTVTVETIKRTFLAGTAVQFGVALFAGYLIHSRRSGTRKLDVSGFHAPAQFLWPFLIAWSVVLLSLVVDIGLLGIVGWNLALVLGLVYFLQGWAIIGHFLAHRNRRLSPGTIVMLVLLFVLVPGINVLFMVGIPLLGVSETWIQYRVVNKENTDENNS
jgi:hypothetical protein